MWIVTSRASLSQGFVLKGKWSCLSGVAFTALTSHGHGCQEFAATVSDITVVGFMAVYTGQMAFSHGVLAGEMGFALDVQMAVQANLRRTARIDDADASAACHNMFTCRPMTRLTGNAAPMLTLNIQAGVV